MVGFNQRSLAEQQSFAEYQYQVATSDYERKESKPEKEANKNDSASPQVLKVFVNTLLHFHLSDLSTSIGVGTEANDPNAATGKTTSPSQVIESCTCTASGNL